MTVRPDEPMRTDGTVRMSERDEGAVNGPVKSDGVTERMSERPAETETGEPRPDETATMHENPDGTARDWDESTRADGFVNDHDPADEARGWERHDDSTMPGHTADRTDETGAFADHSAAPGQLPADQTDDMFDRPTSPDGIPVPAQHDTAMHDTMHDTATHDTVTSGMPVGADTTAAGADSAQQAELMSGMDAQRYRERLRELQADFVDDPQRVVRDAQHLLGEAMESLAAAVAERKRVLDQETPGQDTEDLRVTLRRYRSTLDRLLGV